MTGHAAAWRNEFGGATSLPPAFVGAAAELVAAADLMRRGFPVYRACAPAANFDLVAVVEGRLLRVEVRSASLSASGRLYCHAPARDRWDVLAMVDQHGAVTYRPPFVRPTNGS